MPELPEVETITRNLKHHLVGKKLHKVEVRSASLRTKVPFDIVVLENQEVQDVVRKAKYILFYFSDRLLVIHLGMTGKLVLFRNSFNKHDHIVFRFVDDITMIYNDVRKLGSIEITGMDFKYMAPDPLETRFSVEDLYHQIKSKNSSIKSALMNNDLITGVGNIYANESLFRAGILPTCKCSQITRERLSRLINHLQSTLLEAIADGGSTIGLASQGYRDASEQEGRFQHKFFVYQRTNEECKKCRKTIQKIYIAGRSTFFCDHCQT